jgi:hypothetical protein
VQPVPCEVADRLRHEGLSPEQLVGRCHMLGQGNPMLLRATGCTDYLVRNPDEFAASVSIIYDTVVRPE